MYSREYESNAREKGAEMGRIKRTYSLDEDVVQRLAELANWKRRSLSAQLAQLIDEAHEREQQRRHAADEERGAQSPRLG